MKLLVTYDGSTASASVLRPAERLALRLKAEMVILRIHDARPKGRMSASDAQALEEQWQQSLDDTTRTMTCPARAEVQRLIEHLSVTDAIIDAAVQHGAALIVMATRGENELRHAFIGSTALGVAARSPIPVVLVRSGSAAAGPERGTEAPPRILVAYDGSEASRAALGAACSLARAVEGDVVIAWIHQPMHLEVVLEPDPEKREQKLAQIQQEMTAELERLTSGLSCPSRVIVRPLTNERWSTVDEIRAIASEEGADLICMATRGHSGLHHLLFGSTALEMVGRSDLPVMVVPVEPRADSARAD